MTSVAVDWRDRLLAAEHRGASLLDRSGRGCSASIRASRSGPWLTLAVDAPRRRYAVLYGDASRILVYDETGARVAAVGVAGDGPASSGGRRASPSRPQGDLAVADSGARDGEGARPRRYVRDPSAATARARARFVRLDDVEVDADGVIYASDAYQAWVRPSTPTARSAR